MLGAIGLIAAVVAGTMYMLCINSGRISRMEERGAAPVPKKKPPRQPDSVKLTDSILYEEVEIHRNWTVQVLKNVATGELSVGWWDNEERKE